MPRAHKTVAAIAFSARPRYDCSSYFDQCGLDPLYGLALPFRDLLAWYLPMARKEDHTFDIAFYESILRRDPSYAEVAEILGGLYTKAGRIADGLKMDRKLVRLQPDNATAHYNLACSLALSQRPAAAMAILAQAIVLGYDDADWMEEDPDLAPLHSRPDFKMLLDLVRQAAAPKS